MSKRIIRRKKNDTLRKPVEEEQPAVEPAKPSKPTATQKAKPKARAREDRFRVDGLLSELEELGREGLEALIGKRKPQRFYVGDAVDGVVTRLSKEYIFVDIGAKSEAIMVRTADSVKIGEKLSAMITRSDRNGIEIAKQLSSGGDEALQIAFEENLPIEAKVISSNKGGFGVMAFGKRGFCPISHMDRTNITSPEEYVGKTFWFHITENSDTEFTVSRRKWLQEEQQKRQREFIETSKVGDRTFGIVEGIHNFGIFVNIEGATGLIPQRSVSNLEDQPQLGEEIEVQIAKLDISSLQIGLSVIVSDPWEKVGTEFKTNTWYEGKIAQVSKFGVFVELTRGLTGMLHKSNINYDQRDDLQKHFVPNQVIKVKIASVDRENRKIELSLDPNAGVQTTSGRSSSSTLGDLLGDFDFS